MNQLALELQPVDQSYRIIPLTQGQSAKVSPEDYDWLMHWKWIASWHPVARSFKATRTEKRKTIYMARVILSALPGIEVDHWNHDTLDNRRGNLRPATHAHNCMNRRYSTTSPAKGVRWYAPNKNGEQELRLTGSGSSWVYFRPLKRPKQHTTKKRRNFTASSLMPFHPHPHPANFRQLATVCYGVVRFRYEYLTRTYRVGSGPCIRHHRRNRL